MLVSAACMQNELQVKRRQQLLMRPGHTEQLIAPDAAFCIFEILRGGCGKAGGGISMDPERCKARSTAFGCMVLRPCCHCGSC